MLGNTTKITFIISHSNLDYNVQYSQQIDIKHILYIYSGMHVSPIP